MIYVKELAANDVAYNDGGAQVEFPKKQFGDLWTAGDVTISIKYNKDGQVSETSSVLTVPGQGNFYAREYSRRNGNKSPLKEFFQKVLKLNSNDIGSLLIFEDTNGNGKDFELFLYKPKSKRTSSNVPLVHNNDTALVEPSLLAAIRTKPFILLAGISGTGKSRIVRELAFASCPKELQDKDRTTPGNYCMIEVKPNWHDSTELLGYYSNMNKTYMFSKFVKFLIKAMKHPKVPFFVCLDEMNLAPVEQYFAEFLSELESRKRADEHIVSGALVDAQYFKGKSDSQWYDEFFRAKGVHNDNAVYAIDGEDPAEYGSRLLEERGLSLPDNVIVIGTVNMDDTTHQFSRKVIDRAMTIEMNGGKLKDMFGSSAKLEYREEDKLMTIDDFMAKYVSADEALEKSALSSVADVVKEKLPTRLDEINTCLENTPFQVSYRVLNELVIYLAVLADDNGVEELDELIDRAIDDITLMKILPRIEGDEELLKHEGKSRLQTLRDIMPQFVEKTQNSDGVEETKTLEGRSQKKLAEMDMRLSAMSFTRFWP